MVYCTGLLSRSGVFLTAGSNPVLSAWWRFGDPTDQTDQTDQTDLSDQTDQPNLRNINSYTVGQCTKRLRSFPIEFINANTSWPSSFDK